MSEAVGMRVRSDLELANASDPGCVRETNEDYYVFIEPEADDEFERRGRLALVADGMGGHQGGRVASRLAGEKIKSCFLDATDHDPVLVLRQAFEEAHAAIQVQALSEAGLENMGTTCTAIILRSSQLTLGHIGDSRLYLIRDGRAERLSRDHTLVHRMVEQAVITEQEAAQHGQRHVLTAALGVGPSIEAEFMTYPAPLKPGDILLLCSDGLHALITDEELASVTVGQSVDDAVAELLAWARVRGAPDNVTVQMMKLAGTE